MADIGKGNASLPDPAPDSLVASTAPAAPLRASADDAAFFEFARRMESRLQEHQALAGAAGPSGAPVAAVMVGHEPGPAFTAAFPSLSQKIKVSWGTVGETAAIGPAVERQAAPPTSLLVAMDESRMASELREPEELTAYDLNRLERFGTRKANARWTRNLTTVGIGAAALAAIWAALPDADNKVPPPSAAMGSPAATVAIGNTNGADQPARPIRVVPLVPGGSPPREGNASPADAVQPVPSTSLAALPDLPAVPVATPGEDTTNPVTPAKALPAAPAAALPASLSPVVSLPAASVQPLATTVPPATKPVSEKAHLARPPKPANPDGTIKHARATPAKPVARTASGRATGDDNGQATNVSADPAMTRPPGLVSGQKANTDKGFDPFFIPKFIGRLFTDR